MSETLRVVCPSCPATLVVVIGATSILPKPFKWTCPDCQREHETDFGGVVLRIYRYVDN